MVAALGDLPRCAPPTPYAGSRAHPRGIGAWGTPAPGPPDQDGACPGAACPGRRGLGRPLAGHRQSPAPPPPGPAPRRDPGHPRAGPGPALHTGAPPEGHRHPGPAGRGRQGPRSACLSGGLGHAPCWDTQGLKPAAGCSQGTPRCSRPSAATQPRGGATLGGVRRPQGPLGPRRRPAPDGGTAGGSQPTDISRINRRILLAPPLPMSRGQQHHEDLKKSADCP
jgi:hypothetical protein